MRLWAVGSLAACGGAPELSIVAVPLDSPMGPHWEDDRYIVVTSGQEVLRVDSQLVDDPQVLYAGATLAYPIPTLEGALAVSTNGDLIRIDGNGNDNVLVNDVGQVTNLVASPDGVVGAWTGEDGRVFVFDGKAEGEEFKDYELEGEPVVGRPYGVSEDGLRVLAASDDRSRWFVLTPGTDEVAETPAGASSTVLGAAIGRSTVHIAAADEKGKRVVLQQDGEEVFAERLEGDLTAWADLSPDGTSVLSLEQLKCDDDACATARLALVEYQVEEKRRQVRGEGQAVGLDQLTDQPAAISGDETRLVLAAADELWIVGLADDVE